MEKLKELYTKVAEDQGLQKKFADIMNDAEKSGVDETAKKLIVFAKEAGYDVTTEEIKEFFSNLEKGGDLSEEELDQVAGGKVGPGSNNSFQMCVGPIGLSAGGLLLSPCGGGGFFWGGNL